MEEKRQILEFINTVPNGGAIACKPVVQNLFAQTSHRKNDLCMALTPKEHNASMRCK